MLSRYSEILRLPGTFAMSFATFLARLPFAMLGLGTVLLVSSRTGAYAVAGALSATLALSHALFGPIPARAFDRYGQSRVLPAVVGGHLVALLAFISAVLAGAATPILFALAVLTGALLPDAGALVRARWAFVLHEQPERLQTAFAYEGVVDELVFVLGPPLATVLAVAVADYAALAASFVLMLAGTAVLLPQRRTEPRAAEQRTRSALRKPGVIEVAVLFVFVGGLFGALELAIVAFADERGSRGLAGLLIGVYAFGSATGGLILGATRLRIPLPRQLLIATAVLAVVTIPLPFVDSLVILAPVNLIAGVAVAPVLISSFSMIERLVPNSSLTEALVWTNAGLGIGIAVSAAVAGALIDRSGASAAYALATACTTAAFLVMVTVYPRLSRVWAAAYGVGRATS